MAMRRRASFTAASLTRRANLLPEPNDRTIGTEDDQHHHQQQQQQQTPTSSNNFNPSSPAISTPVTSVEKVTPNILTVLSSILGRLIARNEQHFPVLTPINHDSSKKLSSFQGLRAPSISISKYLERIHKYTNSSLSCFVVAYIYMDRLAHQQPDQPITSMNVHRLLVTCAMVAAKVVDDVRHHLARCCLGAGGSPSLDGGPAAVPCHRHFNNAFYAKVGGISNAELNKLELNLLFCLDFRVQVTVHVFESYCSHMERELHCIGCTPIQRSLPIFGDIHELAHTQQIIREGLDQQ